MNAKALKANFTNNLNLVSSGIGNIVANSQLVMYSSILKLVDDSCAVKPVPNGLKRIVSKNNNV